VRGVALTIRYATLAYGGDGAIYRQATMLLLSLIAQAPQPRELVAVTDRPERFAWFGDLVRIRVLVPGELAAWRGAEPFSMRQKLEAARAVMPSNGALVMLDADTLATASLAPFADAIAAGALFMHKREFCLGTSPRAGNRRLWRALEGREFGAWHFRSTDSMWNSGVLGVPCTDAGLVDAALALYDRMAAAGIRHFATEQLVAGRVLDRTGRLRAAEEWFTHYWGNKDNFDREIRHRLESYLPLGPSAAAAELRRHPIDLPAEVRPGKLAKLRRWLSRKNTE
jgi:hypothetical protein